MLTKPMDHSAFSSSTGLNLERLAVKCLYAADVLQNAVKISNDLNHLQKKVSQYVQQAKLIVTWKKGCGFLKMVGSATKTVGGVMVLVAPLHPKLNFAVKAGHKLWKLGAGLKVLTTIGRILKDLWQSGIRNTLVEFVHATALLSQKLGVFNEVIQDLLLTPDLQNCGQSVNNNTTNKIPDEFVNLLRPFIPTNQIDYVKHVINIVFGNTFYSPLYDFVLMSTAPANSSSIVQLMGEIESFHFTEFLEYGDSKCLIAIGSFLHISRELLDFLDGFQTVTERDCRFLSDCLSRFTQESLAIMKVVNVLTNLNKVRG